MSKNDVISVIIAGVAVVGCSIGAAVCFARAQYYQGKIDKYNEINPILNSQRALISDLMQEKMESIK